MLTIAIPGRMPSALKAIWMTIIGKNETTIVPSKFVTTRPSGGPMAIFSAMKSIEIAMEPPINSGAIIFLLHSEICWKKLVEIVPFPTVNSFSTREIIHTSKSIPNETEEFP